MQSRGTPSSKRGNEIVTVGHGDLKDATWWPKLDSTKNLVQIITTIAWIGGKFQINIAKHLRIFVYITSRNERTLVHSV